MSGLVRYPFPLGRERWAYLYLPSDLTASDVIRLCTVLGTLGPTLDEGATDPAIVKPVEWQPEIGSASENDPL